MRPYTPLELMGRNIYIREGCYACHSQMIRPLRDEAERYGHYSLAAESMYDHPFQWGSKRTGPDLARVGGKYSDEWHVAHMVDPRSVVPESVMPRFGFLLRTDLDVSDIADHLRANVAVGVPYDEAMIENAKADLAAQASVDGDHEGVLARYPKAAVGDFDGQPDATDRDGRDDRLPADSRPYGRLHGGARRRSAAVAGGTPPMPHLPIVRAHNDRSGPRLRCAGP